MRTLEEVIAELAALANRWRAGEDVAEQKAVLERELAHLTGAPDLPAGPNNWRPALDAMNQVVDAARSTRAPSRYIGPNGTADAASHLASGGGFDREGNPVQASGPVLGGGAIIAQPSRLQGGAPDARKTVEIFYDVRDARAGDPRAQQRLAAMSKGMVGGAFLVPQELIGGYVPVRDAANPLRALCTSFTITRGREVRVILEGDGDLTVETVPEGGTKPYSEAAVEQVISTIFKAAGWTDLPDELIEDSGGVAEEIVRAKYARAMGIKVDTDLLTGTGTGQPLGVLADTRIAHTTIDATTGQQPIALYTQIVKAINRVSQRLYSPRVVLNPQVLERFDLDLDDNGNFRFPGGLAGKLLDKNVSVAVDPNVPVDANNMTSIIVGDWKAGVYFFDRKAVAIDVDRSGDAFIEDMTRYRCVERYGAAVVKPSALEVLDGVDLNYVAGV